MQYRQSAAARTRREGRRAGGACAALAQGQWHAPLPLAHRNSIFKSRPQKNGGRAGRLHSVAGRVYGELIKHAPCFLYRFSLSIVNNLVTVRLNFAVIYAIYA